MPSLALIKFANLDVNSSPLGVPRRWSLVFSLRHLLATWRSNVCISGANDKSCAALGGASPVSPVDRDVDDVFAAPYCPDLVRDDAALSMRVSGLWDTGRMVVAVAVAV